MRRCGERFLVGRSTWATGLLCAQPRLIAKEKMPCRKFRWFWTVFEESPSSRFRFRYCATCGGPILSIGRSAKNGMRWRRPEHRPRRDSHDLPVITNDARHNDVTVQLRVRRVRAVDASCGGVAILNRDHIVGQLLDDLAAILAAHQRHPLAHISDGLLDGMGVDLLDLLALPRVAQRPHHRHRLRCAKRRVDPTTTTPTRALRSKPPAGARVAAFHQRHEILAPRLTVLGAETVQRLLC